MCDLQYLFQLVYVVNRQKYLKSCYFQILISYIHPPLKHIHKEDLLKFQQNDKLNHLSSLSFCLQKFLFLSQSSIYFSLSELVHQIKSTIFISIGLCAYVLLYLRVCDVIIQGLYSIDWKKVLYISTPIKTKPSTDNRHIYTHTETHK